MGDRRIVAFFHQIENIAAFLSIFLLALFPTMEVVARKFFHTGVPNSTEFTHYLVLILTYIAGMITSRMKGHLAMALDFKIKPEIKVWIETGWAFLATAMTSAFALSALAFVWTGFDPEQKVWIVPVRWIALALPVGYGVMALRFVSLLPTIKRRCLAALGLLLGIMLAMSSLVSLWHSFSEIIPAWLSFFQNFCGKFIHWSATPLIWILVVSAFFGTPIFVVLGGIAYLLFARAGQPLEVIPNESFSLLVSHSLPALPLFTFTGFLLSESKAGERLVRFFRALFGWFPGGLAVIAVLVCTFFTTFTGASGVTILALGALLAYVLKEGKYGENFSTGLLTASGSIGLLFPPSLPIIVYGVTAGVNIKHLFIGGIFPGIVLVTTMLIFSVVYAKRRKIPRDAFRWHDVFPSFRLAFWEILLPVVIMAAYFGGWANLVESSAVAVIYTLIVEMLIHRDIQFKKLPGVILKCLPIIGGVLTILALANGLKYYIVDVEIPAKLLGWVQANVHSSYIFLLLLNLALLITGCFLDIFSAILVVVPLIAPISDAFGIHPIHLGIIFLANMELGYLTPPVGLNLYLSAYRFGQPITRIYREVVPFLLIQLTAVLLITYLPFLSTFLLRFFD